MSRARQNDQTHFWSSDQKLTSKKESWKMPSVSLMGPSLIQLYNKIELNHLVHMDEDEHLY